MSGEVPELSLEQRAREDRPPNDGRKICFRLSARVCETLVGCQRMTGGKCPHGSWWKAESYDVIIFFYTLIQRASGSEDGRVADCLQCVSDSFLFPVTRWVAVV